MPGSHCSPVSLTTTNRTESDSVRLNIYALLLRLGFAGQDHLSTEDKITLKTIERYFDLKTSEVWTQIEQELKRDDIRPVTPDMEMLHRIRQWNDEQREAIQKAQQELRDTAEQEARAREQADYNRVGD
ncbi:unnamed protein product [Echinostoma caproni]|uniref:PCI domain-containing protein n=1 Tax=Echinostoma caproni TaxID=27848 RepID=A0A183BBE3_9TREM|nr:unnamed protein product [Echinostoma caproni]